jgi:hypothetical protein
MNLKMIFCKDRKLRNRQWGSSWPIQNILGMQEPIFHTTIKSIDCPSWKISERQHNQTSFTQNSMAKI